MNLRTGWVCVKNDIAEKYNETSDKYVFSILHICQLPCGILRVQFGDTYLDFSTVAGGENQEKMVLVSADDSLRTIKGSASRN